MAKEFLACDCDVSEKRTMMTTATENLEDLIALLPGYDPYAQAGDCTFDNDAALDVIEFVETGCTHVKGQLGGQPFLLQPWQKAWFANLFGWKRPNGRRRFRETLVYIPRGNGKTLLGAALVNVMLFLDNEPGSELYSSAAERDQARLCFEMVEGMIINQPIMESAAELFKYVIQVGGKTYKALSCEAKSKHGYSANLIVNDELHAHPNAELTEVLMTSTLKRSQPIVAHLTTADYDRESICNQKYDYACKVRDNVIDDPAFLPVIYEATITDDWTDPEVWGKANPNLPVMDEEYLVRECKRAQDAPAFENTFKRLHLNIRTATDVRWLDTAKWDECEIVKAEELKGQTCFAGLDLASCRDLTAFVMWFPNDDDGTHTIIPTFWIPEDIIRARSKADGVLYDLWERQGWMRTTPGDATDYNAVRRDIDEMAKEYGIREIAVDRLFQGEETAHELGNMGFNVTAFGQGFYSMAAPTKRFDELYHAGKLKHDGNPVMRWMIHNVSVEIDAAGNMKPSKKKSSEKIDGVVSALMALGCAMTGEDATSVYETRGILTL